MSELRRFLRIRDVKHITGLPNSTIYAMMKEGRFPKSFKIDGTKRTAWFEEDVAAWMEAVRKKAAA